MDYYDELKNIRKDLDLDNDKISEITQRSLSVVGKAVSKTQFNPYMRLVVWVYNQTKKKYASINDYKEED